MRQLRLLRIAVSQKGDAPSDRDDPERKRVVFAAATARRRRSCRNLWVSSDSSQFWTICYFFDALIPINGVASGDYVPEVRTIMAGR